MRSIQQDDENRQRCIELEVKKSQNLTAQWLIKNELIPLSFMTIIGILPGEFKIRDFLLCRSTLI